MHRKYSFSLLFVTVFMASAACTPQYPNCKSDSHCQIQAHETDVCVNGICQECRDDSRCKADKGDNYYCKQGRCDKRQPQCHNKHDCTSHQHCLEGMCAIGECSQNSDCTSEQHCNNDGKCIATAPKFSAACVPTDSNEIIALQTIKFDFDRYVLSQESKKALQHNAKCLKEDHNIQIIIEGHCDARGTQEYNLALGQKRAVTVAKYLEALGVSPTQIISRSKGANEPICPINNETCWSQNRRVAFLQNDISKTTTLSLHIPE